MLDLMFYLMVPYHPVRILHNKWNKWKNNLRKQFRKTTYEPEKTVKENKLKNNKLKKQIEKQFEKKAIKIKINQSLSSHFQCPVLRVTCRSR